jgi:MerR family mercuric resistance operon transcriptional regulator
MPGYSIGQLAKAADVPTSTLRFYERAGLLAPDYRTGGNYRGYSERSLERLKFIRAAQSTGLSLQDIAQLFAKADASAPACDDVMAVLRTRLAEIRARLAELRQVERVLAASLESCCRGSDPDLCAQIHRLGAAPPARPTRRGAGSPPPAA